MTFAMKYEIKQRFLTEPSDRRSGIDMPRVGFLVAHDTGNPSSTAANNVGYYERSRNEMSASAHIFVDDIEIIECIPFLTVGREKAWHVLYNVTTDNAMYGDDANDIAGGVELCYGGRINIQEAYKRYIWVLAYACYKYGLNPAKHITGHYILDPARKTDPKDALRLLGKSFQDLINDVVAEYNSCLGKGAAPAPTTSAPILGSPIGNMKVKVDGLRIRNKAGLEGTKVGALNTGDTRPVYYITNGWLCIGHNEFCSGDAEYVAYTPNAQPAAEAGDLPTGILKRGNQSDDVLKLQKALCKVYFYPDKSAANKGCTGFFGPLTENAVKRFQSVYCSTADGIYGPETRKRLLEQLSK